jgi:DNA end-binding protein Ku
MGMLLRYPYEVRDPADYFDDIQDVKITKDMLDLAKHIVETKAGHFEPAKFEDHYEAALQELLEKKQKGQPIAAAKKATQSNVYNLMDALRASIKGGSVVRRPKSRQRLPRNPRHRSLRPNAKQVDGSHAAGLTRYEGAACKRGGRDVNCQEASRVQRFSGEC